MNSENKTSMKAEKGVQIRNAFFTRLSPNIDEIVSGKVKVDIENNVLQAWGPEGYPFDLRGYDVEVL